MKQYDITEVISMRSMRKRRCGIVPAVILCAMIAMAFMPVSVSAYSRTPAKVQGVTAMNITSTTARVKWKKAKYARKYKVYYYIDKDGSGWESQETRIVSGTSCTLYGLDIYTPYVVRVRAFNGTKKGKYSTARQFQTLPDSITEQPKDVTVKEGGTAAFSITARPGSTYQWFFNGIAIAGATGASYSIASVTPSDRGDYSCVVHNDTYGLQVSQDAVLTVISPAAAPVITTQPYSNKTSLVYNSASFSVTATDGINYSWQYSLSGTGAWTDLTAAAAPGSQCAGVTSAKLTVPCKDSIFPYGTKFRCIVSNSRGSTISNAAWIKYGIALGLTNASATSGSNYVFSFSVSGGKYPFTYSWQRKPAGGTYSGTVTPLNIIGPTSAPSGSWTGQAVFSAASPAYNGYTYKLTITDSDGNSQTDEATLTVK